MADARPRSFQAQLMERKIWLPPVMVVRSAISRWPETRRSASKQAVFSNRRASCNAAGTGNGRVGSDPDVMSDLAEVVDTDVFFQHGVTHRAPVNAAVGANFAIVTDHYRTDLRHLFPVIRGESDAEAVGADHHARMNHDTFSKPYTMAERNIGKQAAALAQAALCFQHGAWPDGAAFPDITIVVYHNVRADTDVHADSCRIGNHGRWMNTRFRRRPGIEQCGHPCIGQVGVISHEAIGRTGFRIFLFEYDSACFRFR